MLKKLKKGGGNTKLRVSYHGMLWIGNDLPDETEPRKPCSQWKAQMEIRNAAFKIKLQGHMVLSY